MVQIPNVVVACNGDDFADCNGYEAIDYYSNVHRLDDEDDLKLS